MKIWAGGATEHTIFFPILTTYEQAISSGRISLIADHELLELIAEFIRYKQDFIMHDRLAGDNFYLGGTWEVRKVIGNLEALVVSTEEDKIQDRATSMAFKMTDDDYREFVKKPIVFAAINNAQTLYYNFRKDLTNMDLINEKIIHKLDLLIDN